MGSFGRVHPSSTLIEHWDGASWSVVPSPNPGTRSNGLSDLVALAPDDAWAVGSWSGHPLHNSAPLIMHWDGADWTQVAVPDAYSVSVAPGFNTLTAVDGSGPDDVWAVGIRSVGRPSPFIGTAWHGLR